MTPDLFQEAKRIFIAALERDPTERSAYVTQECSGDEALRKEVESLLACRTGAEDFFQSPPVDAAAEALPSTDHIDFVGSTLSHYTILEKIGEGGMGLVYKARDTHLGRLVALKILPHERVSDPERKRRFVQEAKAASALNHPNIVTIYDIDTVAGVTFIAMEHVNGNTLRQLIARRRIAISHTLKYGVQIAGALATAHHSGIIHRDIKPANIMVTDSGLVKVLDFGLAKLIEQAADDPDASSIPATGKTAPGAILGTVAYMSPEQAEGKTVDGRSDIFSLGSVLYEMITGRQAFTGDTKLAILAAVIHEEPKPLMQIVPETPPEVERAVNRCLRKDPDRRFQNMADVKVALDELREESDSGTLIPTGWRHQRRIPKPWKVALACTLAVFLAVAAWIAFPRRPRTAAAPTVRPVTSVAGSKTRPALSPDGKQLVFAWSGEKHDNFDIYRQLIDESTPHRLTGGPALEYGAVWSPDSLYLAFLRKTPAGKEVIVMPAAGGREQKLHVSISDYYDEFYSGLSWSPKGRFLAMVDKESPQGKDRIFLLDTETRERKMVTTAAADSWEGLPSFSPDGEKLAYIGGRDRPLSDIYVVRISDGGQAKSAPRRITNDESFIFGLSWAADGRSIVFSSSVGGVIALWRVSESGRKVERLTVGGNNAFGPSISRTGDRLAYAEVLDDWNVWRIRAPGASANDAVDAAPLKITSSPQIDMEPVFSPDGRMIVWSSMHSGNHQIWTAYSDGSQSAQLTHFDFRGAAEPRWSPDGRQIAFIGYSRSQHHIYVINADGGKVTRLSPANFDSSEDDHSWSHDGKWIYFSSTRSDGAGIWKVPVSGGPPVFVTPGRAWPIESLDRRFLYYVGNDQSIFRIPLKGGTPLLLARNASRLAESFDGKFVYFSGRDATIWRVSTSGGEPAQVMKTGPRAWWTLGPAGLYILDPDAPGGPTVQLVSYGDNRISFVKLPGTAESYTADILYPSSVSPDGRWILCVHVDRSESNIMLVDNFR